MPKYTHWICVGYLGMVINLNTEERKAAYAICADLGSDKTITTNGNREINEKAHQYFQCWSGWPYAQFVVKQKHSKTLKSKN